MSQPVQKKHKSHYSKKQIAEAASRKAEKERIHSEYLERAQRIIDARTPELIQSELGDVVLKDITPYLATAEELVPFITAVERVNGAERTVRKRVPKVTVIPLVKDCLCCTLQKSGYPYTSVKDKSIVISRVVLFARIGLKCIPEKDDYGQLIVARHFCHVKNCIESSHLHFGTHKKNMEDEIVCGRTGRGENNNFAILTEENVTEILRNHELQSSDSERLSVKELSEKFNVTKKTISNVVSGVTWCHISGLANKRKEASTKAEAIYKEGNWTSEMYIVADAKLTDPNSVKLSTEQSYKGTFCLEWTKGKDKNGYAKVSVNGVNLCGHILRCVIDARRPLAKGEFALHLCDNPPCVRSDHLTPGTQKANCIARSLRPENKKKLSVQDVEAIILRVCKDHRTIASLAKEYSVGNTIVHKIVTGKKWNHLLDAKPELKELVNAYRLRKQLK